MILLNQRKLLHDDDVEEVVNKVVREREREREMVLSHTYIYLYTPKKMTCLNLATFLSLPFSQTHSRICTLK